MNTQTFHRIWIALALLLTSLPVWTSGALASTQIISAQESVRNGNFDQGESAWAKVGSLNSIVAEGNPGQAMRIWPSVLDTNSLAYIVQQIHLPTTTNAVNFTYSYRFESQGAGAVFGSYGAAIYTDLNQPSIVTLHEITDSSQLSTDWQSSPKTLAPSEVTALHNAHAAGQPLLLVILLQATNLSVVVDNISLAVEGAMLYPTVVGTIAFLGQSATNHNTTVNRMAADGSGRQTLWTHPETIAPNIYDVAWKPDATEIAFSSDHEFAYSAFHADVYAMDVMGGNLHRISNPPQKNSWPNGHATGTVTGKIANQGISFPAPFLLYIQGAKEPVSISMPAFGEDVSFSVPDVEDLGVGVSHFAVFAWSGGQCANGKEYHVAVGDVQAGTSVDVGTISFNGLCNKYNATSISWKRDGSAVAFLIGGIPQQVMSSGQAIGSSLFNGTHLSNSDLAWSPVDDRILYTRWRDSTVNDAIYLTSAGSDAGAALAINNQSNQSNPAWLPDGTSFLFTYNGGQAIGRHTLAGSQTQLLINFYGERADNLSLSPDGKYLVFERQNIDNSQRDLWVLNVDKPNEQWPLTVDGRSGNPDWSRQNPSNPAPVLKVYLPGVRK